jgi:site-specific recombinase XerD
VIESLFGTCVTMWIAAANEGRFPSAMQTSVKRNVKCVGNIDVQGVRYEHGERFIQFCFDRKLSAGTATKKIKHLKRVFQLAEDRGQLDRHPLRKLKPPKVAK